MFRHQLIKNRAAYHWAKPGLLHVRLAGWPPLSNLSLRHILSALDIIPPFHLIHLLQHFIDFIQIKKVTLS